MKMETNPSEYPQLIRVFAIYKIFYETISCKTKEKKIIVQVYSDTIL